MQYKVFIDGQSGTTGLQLRQRLEKHPAVEIVLIPEELRKDVQAKKELMNSVDVVFLCLPDAAAKESVTLIENPHVCIIDASTAHRTAPGWDYGFPELSKEHRTRLAVSKQIANPGCHATGFIASVYPLVQLGIVEKDYPFTAHSLTGYSGGGKKMIAEYEAVDREALLDSPAQYALGQTHKHLPEMQHVTGIAYPPVFNPIIGDYPYGMATTVPLITRLCKKRVTKEKLAEMLQKYYQGSNFISVVNGDGQGKIYANELANTNQLKLIVEGNDERISLTALFDNLGKGASGAAVQNMNIALGLDETCGLV